MVSHDSTDIQPIVLHQEMPQFISKDSEEDDRWHVNMDVNNAGYKMLENTKVNGFNMLIRPQGFTQYVGE